MNTSPTLLELVVGAFHLPCMHKNQCFSSIPLFLWAISDYRVKSLVCSERFGSLSLTSLR